jgi:protein SCO1/2
MLNIEVVFINIQNIVKRTFLVFFSLFFTLLVFADGVPAELGIYENLDSYLPDNLDFIDENAKPVNLKTQINKPTVIALVYYECPGLCSPLLEGVAEVITKAKIDLGTEYQVFTVSFDPTEKAELARAKKDNYSKLVSGKDVENGWKWLTGDSANVSRLLNTLGYKVKKEGDEFIHPASIIVISPQGKITRYLHGTYFLPFDLKMAVVEASEERSSPTINKVLKFCFSYDAEGKKYVFNITKVAGTIILLFAGGLFLFLAYGKRRKTKDFRVVDN